MKNMTKCQVFLAFLAFALNKVRSIYLFLQYFVFELAKNHLEFIPSAVLCYIVT